MRTRQPCAEPADRPLRQMHIDASRLAQSGFDRIDDPFALRRLEVEPVDNDMLYSRRCLFDGMNRVVVPDPIEARTRQYAAAAIFHIASPFRQCGRESQNDRGLLRQICQGLEDRLWGVATDGPAASLAMKDRHPGEEELQVIVEFRDRPDRRAGGLDRVPLGDCQRRRNPLDPLRLRPVHPFHELTGIGRKGFDVATLTFRIEHVKGERGLAGAAHTGDDDQLAEGKVKIEPFEIVLSDLDEFDGVHKD